MTPFAHNLATQLRNEAAAAGIPFNYAQAAVVVAQLPVTPHSSDCTVPIARYAGERPSPEQVFLRELHRTGQWCASIDAFVSAIRYAKESGRWITIGAVEGEDGKKHGGSPVYIENGRITKGAPSSTGRRIDALDEEGKRGGHRQELNQSKAHARAVWAKKARKEGIKPANLHQLAAEMLEHDRASKEDVTKLLREVRHYHPHTKAISANAGRGIDMDAIRGLDEIADSMAHRSEYRHLFHDSPDVQERLFDLLVAGNPQHMTEDEAYEEAFEQLLRDKDEAKGGRWKPSDEPIPERRGIPEARYAGPNVPRRVPEARYAGPPLGESSVRRVPEARYAGPGQIEPWRYAGLPGVGIDPEVARRGGQSPEGTALPKGSSLAPPGHPAAPPHVRAAAQPAVPQQAPAFDLSAEIRRLRSRNVPQHIAVAVAHRNRDRHSQGLPLVTPTGAAVPVAVPTGPPERPEHIPAHVWRHLTPEEQGFFAHPTNHDKGRAAMEYASRMATHPEHTVAIQAGIAQKDWYDLSERVVGQFGEHAPLVAHLLAANSTKNPPARNLLEALAIYRAWVKAKPKDRQVVPWERVQADGRLVKTVTMPFLQKLAQEPGMGGILFGARHTPTVRVLAEATAPERGLTGQKTRNFAGNLNPADPNSRNRVTNDVWQAIFHSSAGDADAVQKLFNDMGVYAASSAGVRRAASAYGIDPRQAQAAIWSGMMTMAGMAKAGLTPAEIVRYITHEHVANAVDSFFNLIGRDERVRAELQRIDHARGSQTLEGVIRLAQDVGRERERSPGPRGPIFAATPARTRRVALALAARAARYATSYRGSVEPFDDAILAALSARNAARHARGIPEARYCGPDGIPEARYAGPEAERAG